MKEYIKYGIGVTIGFAIGSVIVETVKHVIIRKTDSKDEKSE